MLLQSNWFRLEKIGGDKYKMEVFNDMTGSFLTSFILRSVDIKELHEFTEVALRGMVK